MSKPHHIKVVITKPDTEYLGRPVPVGKVLELIDWDAQALMSSGKARRFTGDSPAPPNPLAGYDAEALFDELGRRAGEGVDKLKLAVISEFSAEELFDELERRGHSSDPADFPSVGALRDGSADWNASRAALRALGVTGRGREELADEWAAWLEIHSTDTPTTDDTPQE